MKTIWVSIITSSAVSLSWMVWLIGLEPGQDAYPDSMHITTSDEAPYWQSIVQLRHDISELSTDIAQYKANDLHALRETMTQGLERLQLQIDQLDSQLGSESVETTTSSDTEPLDRFDEMITQTPEVDTYLIFEQQFEDDLGSSMGAKQEILGDILHGRNDLNISAIDCRSSMCRITYEGSTLTYPMSPESSNSELVDQLVAVMGGQGVELSFTQSPSGEQLMFMRLL
ncbi:MAG: hypothetical protein AAGB19_13765 [Cyanobacteria bacterium P01_F01_bin.3]